MKYRGSRYSRANCYKEVATDGVREATQSHASESPVPGEGMEPEQPGQTKNTRAAEQPD